MTTINGLQVHRLGFPEDERAVLDILRERVPHLCATELPQIQGFGAMLSPAGDEFVLVGVENDDTTHTLGPFDRCSVSSDRDMTLLCERAHRVILAPYN